MAKKKGTPSIKSQETPCTCKLVGKTLLVYKLLGLFPAYATHAEEKCIFKLSYPWLLYSICILLLVTAQMFSCVDLKNFGRNKFLTVVITDITNIMQFFMTIFLLFFSNFVKIPQTLKTLNLISDLVRGNQMCGSSFRIASNVQYACMVIVFGELVCQTGTFCYLNYFSEQYAGFDYNVFLNGIIYECVVAFALFLFAVVNVVIGVLACHEKLSLSSFNYIPVHPLESINERNNRRDFFGTFSYSLCSREHFLTESLSLMGPAQRVEYLRRLHEDVCTVMYKLNDAVALNVLVLVVTSLCVIILQLYCVIIYLAYDLASPETNAIFVQQCFSVLSHVCGIFFLFRNIQFYSNMIKGFTNILIEYSTRISSEEEHQQVRIFIEKLKHHRPFTVCGIFTPDLGLCGPICANILTYVLVALQFDIPKMN